MGQACSPSTYPSHRWICFGCLCLSTQSLRGLAGAGAWASAAVMLRVSFFLPCNSCTKKMCYNEYGCKTHRCRLRRSAARATESAATDAAKADAAARAAVRGEDADMEAEVQRLQVRISL